MCDFLHNKVLVTNRTVVTGSFNLPRSAESNAENALAIHEARFAGDAKYAMGLVATYSNA